MPEGAKTCVVYPQTTEHFLRCSENAFEHFGGVPQTLVIDSLKAAVGQADWGNSGDGIMIAG